MDEGDKEPGVGTPGPALSREEVMAQRAQKKLLKEARKNKSLAGGSADCQTPEVKQKGAKSQKQLVTPGPPKVSNVKQPQTPLVETPKSGKQKVKPQQHQQPTTTISIETTPSSESKPSAKDIVTPEDGGKVPPDGTPENVLKQRNALVGKPTFPEYQSTIQSLFHVKKESTKVKNFCIHPLFQSLGVKLRHDVVRGANPRCIALLHTIREFVEGYRTPSGMSFKHGLSSELQANLDGLRVKCPFAIGMNNAIEFLNNFLYKMDQDVGDVNQQKEEIMDVIDQYIEEKINKALEAIMYYAVEKEIFRTGDVILVYSITDATLTLLEKVAEKASFEIILIQTPETILDIPVLLKRLSKAIQMERVTVSSVNFSNAIYRMRHCNKILIGGHGLFTTGGVMAQSGSAKLALLAATYNKPAIFLCETYKFCDRSPLDFFTLDEYIPEQSITEDELFEPKIKYDVTPANLVTVVITDIELLPSTSVPVVLRVQEGRTAKKDYQNTESP